MDSMTLMLIALRAAALGMSVSQSKTADSLFLLADMIEAGKATDAHMRTVAEKLKSRSLTQADWDDVINRIQTYSEDLQS